jgi:hypothetical protein
MFQVLCFGFRQVPEDEKVVSRRITLGDDALVNAARVAVIALAGTRSGPTLLHPALSRVRGRGQTGEIRGEGIRLAKKQSHGG